jgi:hypothetical protein
MGPVACGVGVLGVQFGRADRASDSGAFQGVLSAVGQGGSRVRAGYMPRWIAFVALDRDLLALERLRGTVATCDALWLQHCGYMHTRSEKSGAMSPWRLGGRRECRADGTRACGG